VAEVSAKINRQIGLLINRKGQIEYIIIGDANSIVIPPLDRYRSSLTRLNGLRCIHTHLSDEPLTQDDLLDLALLRLDLMAVLNVGSDGAPGRLHAAHVLPSPVDNESHDFLKPLPLGEAAAQWDFLDMISALEEELSSKQALADVDRSRERAVLISVSDRSARETEARLDELSELATSAGLRPVGRSIQRKGKKNPKFLLGKGKLGELSIFSLQHGARLWIFDQELSPSQVKELTSATDLKVIDRTQLILDIFAQRARTREGKIQVELAQLKYLLPRLVGKTTALSRLAGGIGTRGPGETKLEIDRRRARERIGRLQRDLTQIRGHRDRQRKKRQSQGMPVVSLVGYTNAGKSTLLNTLTNSHVTVRDQLFATLDPTSRRLFLTPGHEVILTDTVGFIRDLPHDLMDAFMATLEELNDTDLLIHLVDASNPDAERHIEAVDRILSQLDLERKENIILLNKSDKTSAPLLAALRRRYNALAVSALDKSTLPPLLAEIEHMIFDTAHGRDWTAEPPRQEPLLDEIIRWN